MHLHEAQQLPSLKVSCTSVFDLFISDVSEIWPTKFLETDVILQKNNISRTQELKHISQSCEEHWKAYLIVLLYNNFTFIQLWAVILDFPSNFSFPQGFCSSLTSNGTSMSFQSMTNHISMESVFRSLLIGYWPKERVVAAEL